MTRRNVDLRSLGPTGRSPFAALQPPDDGGRSNAATAPGAQPAGASGQAPRVVTLDLTGGAKPQRGSLELLLGVGRMRSDAGFPALAGQPLDAPDFFAWHHLFTSPDDDHPILGGFRGISLATCEQYGIDLSALWGSPTESDTADALRAAVSEHRDPKEPVVYYSDFWVIPELRLTRASLAMHELLAALVADDFAARQISCALGRATPQTLRFFQRIGYEPIGPVDPPGSTVGDTMIRMLRPSDYAEDCRRRNADVLAARRVGT